mmetsp:Transcript_2775/g.4207  ORF Transcript_2775/g.4207 Transcript_2775/m.4207 type:complete len:203 (+) Transcript_2775:2525-3133(+)
MVLENLAQCLLCLISELNYFGAKKHPSKANHAPFSRDIWDLLWWRLPKIEFHKHSVAFFLQHLSWIPFHDALSTFGNRRVDFISNCQWRAVLALWIFERRCSIFLSRSRIQWPLARAPHTIRRCIIRRSPLFQEQRDTILNSSIFKSAIRRANYFPTFGLYHVCLIHRWVWSVPQPQIIYTFHVGLSRRSDVSQKIHYLPSS